MRALRIGHLLGTMRLVVRVDPATTATSQPLCATLGFGRTARRLIDGAVYVPSLTLESRPGVTP
jgi:2-methylaconitate cis-trans-isomerase PrpF